MSKTTTIVVVPSQSGFSIAIPSEAARLKEAALSNAKRVSIVSNQDEQEEAIHQAARIKGLIAQTESTRVDVKKPYYKACQAIDAKAAEYVKELKEEAVRLERLVAGFQAAEQAKAEQARREAEEKRRAAERAAQQERDRLAEIERQKAEAERRAIEAKTKKAREAAAAEAKRLEDERQSAEIDVMEAQDDLSTASATVVTEEPPAARGAAVSSVREFEVTDADALYAFDLERRRAISARFDKPLSEIPSWFTMEVKKRELKEFISVLQSSQLDRIPGLRITERVTAAVRAVAPSLSLH